MKRDHARPSDADGTLIALEAAASALAIGDEATALTQLLTAWRTLPTLEIAALVEMVSERAAETREPIAGKTLKERHKAFVERAQEHDARDLPHLLAVIPTVRSKEAAAELDILVEWPPDPRHTPFFLAMIRKPPYRGSATAKVWRRVFDVLLASGDPRLIAELPALVLRDVFEADVGGGSQASAIAEHKRDTVVAKLKKKFPSGPPKPSAKASELAARMTEQRKAIRQSADELYARVLAEPNDDATRLVYADALQETNDPRGELIVLQFQKLSRALTPVEARREKALIHDNFARWFGELAPIVVEDGTVFDKGFPVRVCVKLENDSHRRLALGHPVWSTVTTIDLTRADSLPLEVLAHPVMRSLTGVVNVDREVFVAIARRAQPLGWTHFGYSGPNLYADETAPDRAQNEEDRSLLHGLHRVLPSLTRLSLSGYGVGVKEFQSWLWDVPIVHQLERLDVSSGIAHLASWVAEVRRRAPALPKLRELGIAHHWEFSGWSCVVSHGEGAPFSVLRAHMHPKGRSYSDANLGDLAKELTSMPVDQLTSIIVTAARTTKAGVAEIERAARRQTRLVKLELP